MGQSLSCLSCKSRNIKVIPLGTMNDAGKHSKSTLSVQRNASFHRPVRFSLERLSTQTSARSSLATISLGSVQTLSSAKEKSPNRENKIDEHEDGSPSDKRHPGMVFKNAKISEFSVCQLLSVLKQKSHNTH